MNTFVQYKNLLAVLIRNTLSFNKFNKKGSKKGKALAATGIGFAVIMLCFYAAMTTTMLTIAMGDAGMLRELFYGLIFSSQMVVLFFGGIAIMSYMFYSKDNALLTSLPINSKALFAAKLTMAYIAEMFFAALVLLPTLTTAGIVSLIKGYGIQWHFFVVEIAAIIFTPIIPLLIVSLLSMPLMYVVSFFKKRAVGNGLVLALIYIGAMALYFAVVFSFTNIANGEEGALQIPASTLNTFIGMKKITIFNYPIVEALAGSSPALNTFIYIGGLAVVLVIAIIMSRYFYARALAILAESRVSFSKNKKAETVESASLAKTFLMKEIRTLVHTPILLMTSIMGLVLPSIIVFFINYSSRQGFGEGFNGTMYIVGISTYISYLMASSTNQVATIGFSREGKNLLMLKSLPISAKTMIDSKLIFAVVMTILSGLFIGIVFPFATGVRSPSLIIGLPLVTVIGGFGTACMSLLNDLKNPNLKWNNITELTKNNKRVMKPMFVALGIGLFYMVMGILLGVQNALQGELLFFVYYCVCAVPILIIAVVSYKRLYKNPEELLARIEG